MNSPVQLLPQMEAAIPGVTAHGTVLGLPAGLAATMELQHTDLQTAQSGFLDKVKERKASQAAKRAAMKSARALIELVRAKARPTLGGNFSQDWAALGFAGSLRVPRSVPGLVSMLGTMAEHLTSHPQFGGENFDAADTTAVKDALTAAVTAVNVKKSEVRQKHELRAAKAAAVRLILREVLAALRLKLGPLDGRWAEFGFNMPGAQAVPSKPTGVTASIVDGTSLLVKWPAVPRAEYYRYYLKVDGQHTELTAMGNTTELQHLFEGLPPNTGVEVAISAANNGGEGVVSATITLLTQ